ncbi:uncharacterized protein MONOS_8451 [Monocercomonoides exilis]|uniref:uncharacterized protein n=1 Tax=Monocercomonoides exilis TaxID=2049356 RepID=UPI00355A9F38|nr:hypothetical protein MONOS_8451 [Monocercomonoides exilis]|eukprot:MONOS_8451.1-p1 / transcript=MONOS_8451.1 / gene=MONOS_8451 / organism=Monocercomonoides_exilis_PA203 / gene_product=unspecified product / transcript_product=unspecified product / location=Mono_scaffold00319:2768-3025(-) / protein_length=86 / sequence_SO=supercontig / SO=protein_coding / is_pseudo=false
MTTAIGLAEWRNMRRGTLLALKLECRWITWTSSAGNPSVTTPTAIATDVAAADANADSNARPDDSSHGTGASEQDVRRECVFLNK